MIYPVPLFGVREWGTHVGTGHTCPSCLEGHLEEYVVCGHCLSQVFLTGGAEVPKLCSCGHVLPEPGKGPPSLQCNSASCRSFYQTSFARQVYGYDVPARVGALPTLNMPLFASVQHYLDLRPSEDSLHHADFVMDIDRGGFEEALAALLALVAPLEQHGVPHQVYFSGAKGFHVVVPAQVLGARPAMDLNHVQYHKLALHLTELTGVVLDPAIYTRARLLREPLTLHGKTGLYKVPLRPGEYARAREIAASPDGLPLHYLPGTVPGPHPVAEGWFREAQGRVLMTPDPKGGRYSQKLSGLGSGNVIRQETVMPCIQNALENGPPMPGTRNRLNKVMATFFLSQGEDEDAMVDWAQHTPGASTMRTQERMNEARGTFRWVKRTQYDFDCRDMREMGLCDPKCPLLQMVQPENDIFGGVTMKFSS